MNEGKIKAQATWGSSPTGWRSAPEFAPGTAAFFEKALKYRNEHEIPWLSDVVPFEDMAGKKVLEIGFGPGFDAFAFVSNGAAYAGIDLTAENVQRATDHLALYDKTADLRQGDAEALPFERDHFDVVYSNGVLHHTPDIEASFREVSRVLAPGGRCYVILYHKNSLFYRLTLGVWYHIILGGFLRETLAERLASIEANPAGVRPIVNVYSKREFSKLLSDAGLVVEDMQVRKLTWEDLPALPLVWRAYRYIPQGLLDWLAKSIGWYVVGIATKLNRS